MAFQVSRSISLSGWPPIGSDVDTPAYCIGHCATCRHQVIEASREVGIEIDNASGYHQSRPSFRPRLAGPIADRLGAPPNRCRGFVTVASSIVSVWRSGTVHLVACHRSSSAQERRSIKVTRFYGHQFYLRTERVTAEFRHLLSSPTGWLLRSP